MNLRMELSSTRNGNVIVIAMKYPDQVEIQPEANHQGLEIPALI